MIAAVLLEAEALRAGNRTAPGVVDLLRRIHHAGRLVALVSLDGAGPIATAEMDPEVARYVHARAWGRRSLEEAADALCFRPEDTAVVAGSPRVARAAVALGARTIGLAHGGRAEGALRRAGATEVHAGPEALCARWDTSGMASTVLTVSDQITG